MECACVLSLPLQPAPLLRFVSPPSIAILLLNASQRFHGAAPAHPLNNVCQATSASSHDTASLKYQTEVPVNGITSAAVVGA